MNILKRLFKGEAKSASDPLSVLAEMLRAGYMSKAGQTVNLNTALQVAVVFDCLRVLGEGVAQVPLKLQRETVSAVSVMPEIQPAKDHPLYDLLATAPNDWQSSFEFREQMIWHAALTGNAYAFINRVRGRVSELLPLQPAMVTVKQETDYRLTYKVNGASGASQTFPQEAILHLRGPSWNGALGLDVLSLARNAIGLGLAMEESHSGLHKNGLSTSGTYSIDGELTDEEYKKLRKWIEEEYAKNKGAPLILDNGAKWLPITMSGVDAQHLESRKHQIEEVCRFFRVMPIMLGYSEKNATYASSEQQFLAHLVHTLSPWYARIEQALDAQLLTRVERQQGLYFRFNAAGLLRGDLKTTSEYLTKMTIAGIMTRNEARAKTELNPLEGLDEPLTPTNMTTDPTGAPAGDDPPPPPAN